MTDFPSLPRCRICDRSLAGDREAFQLDMLAIRPQVFDWWRRRKSVARVTLCRADFQRVFVIAIGQDQLL